MRTWRQINSLVRVNTTQVTQYIKFRILTISNLIPNLTDSNSINLVVMLRRRDCIQQEKRRLLVAAARGVYTMQALEQMLHEKSWGEAIFAQTWGEVYFSISSFQLANGFAM